MPRHRNVAAPDLSGWDHRAVSDRAWPDHPALPTEKDRRLIEQHTARHIADQRGRSLIPMRRKVEVDIRRADLRMVFRTRPASHQRITEVNQTAGRDPRHKDRLFDAYAVRDRRLLFE